MKFRDPKTGKVFDSFERAHTTFCRNHECRDCALNNYKSLLDCVSFYKESCDEAARLMGYEVVADTDNNPTLRERIARVAGDPVDLFPELHKEGPRICQVLGVEVGERFSIDGYPTDYGPVQVCEDGKIRRVISEKEFPFANDGEVGHKIGSNALYYLLNHPDRIIRKPYFTEEEVADARAIVRVLGGDLQALKRTESGELIYGLLRINRELLPSLRPGQFVALSDVIDAKKAPT